jgi:hypothetical protein
VFDKTQPLWLPAGSVRAVMALFIVVGTFAAVIWGREVPAELLYLAMAIAAAYTGVRAWQQTQGTDPFMQAINILNRANRAMEDDLQHMSPIPSPAPMEPVAVEEPAPPPAVKKPRKKRTVKPKAAAPAPAGPPLSERVAASAASVPSAFTFGTGTAPTPEPASVS